MFPGSTTSAPAVGSADVVEGLRRRWPLALLVAIPLFAGGVLYAESLPDSYESTSIVALTPRPDIDVGGDVLRTVVPKYVAFLDSQPTLAVVAAEVGVRTDDLRDGVDVSVPPETANLNITVELRSPEDAAAAAAALAQQSVVLSRSDRLLEAEVLVPPVASQTPAGPPRRLIEAGSLLLALIAGITIALVADRSQPRISTAADLANVSGLRALGTLLRSRRLRDTPAAALDDPAVSASIGTLLVQLDSESRLQPVRVLAVTSPSPGDGKTTVAALLATGLARLEARVLLLDADLRRPRLAQQLGIPPSGPGLGDVLEGGLTLQQVVVRDVAKNLDVVRASVHPDASNLLARRLPDVLGSIGDEYDTIVLDCPPVLATDDALVVTVTSDAVMLVVDRGSRSALTTAAVSTLQGLKVRMVGAVLNRARSSGRGAGAYGSYGRR